MASAYELETSVEIILIDEKLLTLKVYPELKIVTHQLHGFVEGEPFRNMLLAGVRAFQKYGCNSWLSDDSKNSMVSLDDLEWGRNVWEPRMFETDWKRWALVFPEKLFGNMAMKGIAKYYLEHGIDTEVFRSYDDAFSWLKTQSES